MATPRLSQLDSLGREFVLCLNLASHPQTELDRSMAAAWFNQLVRETRILGFRPRFFSDGTALEVAFTRREQRLDACEWCRLLGGVHEPDCRNRHS